MRRGVREGEQHRDWQRRQKAPREQRKRQTDKEGERHRDTKSEREPEKE